MKKIIVALLIMTIALTCFTGFTYEDVYAKCGIVTALDYEEDLVSVTDFGGNVWQFFGCEDWVEGDICAMVMDRNDTAEIFDDIIVNTTYCGWIY